MVSRRLQDSANRLFNKASVFIEKGEYEKALKSLEEVNKLMKKEKDPEISFQSLFLKGQAMSEAGDPERAMEFYGDALKFIELLFSEEAGKEDYHEFVSNTIEEIRSSLLELNDEKRAKELLKPMKKQFGGIVRTFEGLVESNPEDREYLSVFLGVIGSMVLCYWTGRLMDETVEFFDKKIEVYEKIFELEPGEEDLLRDFDEDVEIYGLLFRNHWYPEEAEGSYLRAAGIYRKVIENEPKNNMAEYYLSYTYSYLGDLYSGKENLEKAEQYYKEAVELMEKGYKEFPEDHAYAISLARLYEGFGTAFSESEEPEKSITNYTRAREVYRDLIINHPSEFAYNKNIAMYLDKLGDLFSKIGEIEDAELCYKDQLGIYENLHDEDPDDLNPILGISDTFSKLGDLFAKHGETEKARGYYEKEIEVYESLLEEEPDAPDYMACKAEIQVAIGKLYLENDPETARKYFEEAFPVLEKALELEPGEKVHYLRFRKVLNNFINLFKKIEDYEKAVETYSKLLAVQKRMIDLNPEERGYEKELAATYTTLSFLHSEKGDIEQEAHYQRLAFDIYEKILKEAPDDPLFLQGFVNELYFNRLSLDFRAKTRGEESDIARNYLELAKKAEEKLRAIKPEKREEQELYAEINEKMGISYREREMYREAIEELERSLAIRKKLHENYPKNENYITVLEGTFYQMGLTFLAKTDMEKAKEAFEEAMNLNAKLLESDPEDFDFLARSSMILDKYSNVLEKMGETEEAAKYRSKAEQINADLGLDYK